MPNALKGEEALAPPGRRWSLRSFLIVAQISVSLILLCAAGLFLWSLESASKIDVGFRSRGVIKMAIDRSSTVTPPSAPGSFSAPLVNASPHSPESSPPLSPTASRSPWAIAATALKSPAVPSLRGKQRRILHGGPDYFATLGVRRVALRDLGEENSTATEVGVVNEEFARRFFQGTNPVGHMVTGAGVPYQIVGVVKDTKRARSIKTSALSSTAPSTSSSTSIPRRMATPSWLDLRPGSGLERAGQERKFFLTDSDLVQDAPLKRGQGCETDGFNH